MNKRIVFVLIIAIVTVCCLALTACDGFPSQGGNKPSEPPSDSDSGTITPVDPSGTVNPIDPDSGTIIPDDNPSSGTINPVDPDSGTTDSDDSGSSYDPVPSEQDILIIEQQGDDYVVTGVKSKNFTEILIPDYVTSIGIHAFLGCSGLERIIVSEGNSAYHSDGNCLIETATKTLILGCKNSIIPTDGSVTSIGYQAFCYCCGLTSITIPDSVTDIGVSAFAWCGSLTSVTIGKGVTSIGSAAFWACDGLSRITIPDNVTNIDSRAFYGCRGLTSVTIGESVTNIYGDGAFEFCEKLVEVYNLSSLEITAGSTANGCVGKYALDVYTSLDTPSKLSTTEDGYIIHTDGEEKTLVGYTGNETELTLPSGITSINKYAFCDNEKITSVIIPDSVTSIGNYAFYGCSGLTSVTIGNSVTSIGEYAFA